MCASLDSWKETQLMGYNCWDPLSCRGHRQLPAAQNTLLPFTSHVLPGPLGQSWLLWLPRWCVRQ